VSPPAALIAVEPVSSYRLKKRGGNKILIICPYIAKKCEKHVENIKWGYKKRAGVCPLFSKYTMNVCLVFRIPECLLPEPN
jgi:hypothetical protein